MAEARIRIAKRDILKLFDGQQRTVLKKADIEASLDENREFWRLRRTMTAEDFLGFLLQETKLRKVEFDFPHRKIVRYVWGRADMYELLMSIDERCYLSHYTAVQLHGLSDQVPKTIYVNKEQPAKRPPSGDLVQERIDAAFKRPTRVSRNFVNYKDRRIYLLSGKQTGNLGIIETEGPEDSVVRVTGIERTLIDITVRPEYAGGVFEVLKAYRLAQGSVSVNKLVATLRKLDYVYPYHQAIGFYLDRTGVYKESSITLLRRPEFKYDFYLMHQIRDRAYSKKWRLFFPKGL
jgi:predicted transcriptional regulator of viral defense system